MPQDRIVKDLVHAKAALRASTAPPRHGKTAPRAGVDVADNCAAARLVSKPEVLDRIGVTYPTIWKWMRGGSFPRSRAVGGKAFWIEAEIEKWITDLPVRRLKGDDKPEVA